MTNVCFYFQIHQPFRLRKYSLFDIGNNTNYFDDEKNRLIMEKVATKCYLPANMILLDQIKKHRGKFKVSFSITGTALEQFEKYVPEVLESFKKLSNTGCVEFLSETYYHSLAFLFNKEEFKEQVYLHSKAIKKYFGQRPSVFRNTELCYNNELASFVEKIGYKGILAEGADHILGWRSPNFVYRPRGTRRIRLLLKNYRLSDDIAFRFSEHKLTARQFADWIAPIAGDSINLFLDYETFGEHHWEASGIFRFLKELPSELLKRGIGFSTPSEVLDAEPKDVLNIPSVVSWADIERDVSAWLGNKMQFSASESLYNLRNPVLASGNRSMIDAWRKLSTSDHFYYMCTKWFADGDVHKYFNPYDTPYDAFIAFMNVLNDFLHRFRIENSPSTVVNTFVNSWIKV